MRKNIRIYTLISIFIFIILFFLNINPNVISSMGPHTIAGKAYYNFNNSKPAINATVDIYNKETNQWINNTDIVSTSGSYMFNVGTPGPGWSEGDELLIYIHQDNPGKYNSWNGLISTIINMETSPQIIDNCYLLSTSNITEENNDTNDDLDNINTSENIQDENNTNQLDNKENNEDKTKDNIPPNKPIIIGPTKGIKKKQYNYTIYSSDFNNDSIQFIIDWDDNTNLSETIFISNNSSINISHIWDQAGVYFIKIYAKDYKNASSEFENITVLIDAIYCGSIGYLIDNNRDNVYDIFYSNDTNKKTNVEKDIDGYKIDNDNDGKWDFLFNTNLEIEEYKHNKETPAFETIYLFILLFIVVLLFKKKI